MDRGRDYVRRGHVLSVEALDHLRFRGEVEGSDVYEVYVQLDEEEDVLSAECDCPYDYGLFCKHIAAVLLMLQEDRKEVINTQRSETSRREDTSLKALLENESKDSLIYLIGLLADEHRKVEQRVRLYVEEDGRGSGELDGYRKIIQTYIEECEDHHGFVRWRDTGKAVKGAELVAEKAEEAVLNKEWTQAVEINLCIMEEMADLIQFADDSSGDIGDVIEESLERLHDIMEKDQLMQEGRMVIFQRLLEGSAQSQFEGWPDWQLALLRFASQLVFTEEMREKWERQASVLTAKENDGGWTRNYFSEEVAFMRYQQMKNESEDEQARDYVKEHLHLPKFREMAIREALQKAEYDEAICLAEEGEMQGKESGLHGLVNRWKAFRFDAYARSGQIEKQRELGKEFLLNGDFSYYDRLKETYSQEQWVAVYKDLLQRLEQGGRRNAIYTKILVEEEEYTRLLAYVKEHPNTIETFHPLLKESFPEEVKELFLIHIENQADHSTDRKQYADVCKIIRKLKQIGGQEEARQIVQKLLAKFPRKPAFRDELMKVDTR
ncbi:SWIM zinc finger family protein [Shouchella shacheensis]|uniref:SWIM zinc finger family protein n=1 Tax=Shouchella shacheensis TaxID=1649580 RepID=UPI0015D659F6|nr:SWIM zinc finger family protein [Shouchella shacheensis]